MDLPLAYPDPPLSDGVVTLRPFDESDIPALVAALQDPEIPRFTRVPSRYTESDARDFLRSIHTGLEEGTAISFAVVDATSARLIGSSGLVRIEADESRAEIGYWTAQEARAKGTATRAAKLVACWAIETLGLARIAIHADPANAASQRVAEACGFTREGTLRSYHLIKGERHDSVVFSLLESDPRPS